MPNVEQCLVLTKPCNNRYHKRLKYEKKKHFKKLLLNFSFQGKTWSLEDERDEDEEDLQNVVIPQTDLKRDVVTAREAMISSQADKQREAMERAAQAAALASAACANVESAEDDDDDDPLDKFMEDIAKEVKSFRGNKSDGSNTKVLSNNPKGSVIKLITKTVKNEVRIHLINFDIQIIFIYLFFIASSTNK